MKLEYNGVPLGVVRLVQHSAVPEYDETGMDYLWTRVRLTVECVYSPQATAAGHKVGVTAAGTAQEPTAAVLGRRGSPALTDTAIRHLLSQPRRLLKVWFDSALDPALAGDAAAETWIESPRFDPAGPSPADRLPCDPGGGPWVHDLSVSEVMVNGRTCTVAATFETCLLDCLPNQAQVPCLSNQFTATMSYDRDGYCTRRFVGLAVFRRDLLEQRQYTPDDFRLDLLPPPPRNTLRTVDKLLQSADGHHFAYEVTDEEQPVTYLDKPERANGLYPPPLSGPAAGLPAGQSDPAGPAGTRRPREVRTIKCEVVREYTSKGAGAVADRIAGIQLTAPWAAGALEFQAARDIMGEFEQALPQYTEQAVCYVRGTRRSRKTELLALAYSTALAELTTPIGADLLSSVLTGVVAPPIGTVTGLGRFDMQGTYQNVFARLVKLMAPATTLRVRFDRFDRWVEVTVAQEYGGILDWVLGGQAGGFRALVSPVRDDAVGANWPTAFLAAQGLQANPLYSIANDTLLAYPLPDAGLRIGAGTVFPDQTTEFGPGLQPPVLNGRQGTNLAELVAAGLSRSCTPPFQYRGDRAEVPSKALPRPSLPLPGEANVSTG